LPCLSALSTLSTLTSPYLSITYSSPSKVYLTPAPFSIKFDHTASYLKHVEFPTIHRKWRALVMATFMRRWSRRKPRDWERTVEIMMKSFSRPWKASTVLTSMEWTDR
jgi:hypothetical protein